MTEVIVIAAFAAVVFSLFFVLWFMKHTFANVDELIEDCTSLMRDQRGAHEDFAKHMYDTIARKILDKQIEEMRVGNVSNEENTGLFQDR